MPTKIDPSLRKTHASVYAALRECWLDYGQCPSQVELSHATQLSTTTVIQAIRELRKRGYILAPKFTARGMRPTDVDLEILTAKPDPWSELQPPRRYWKPDTK